MAAAWSIPIVRRSSKRSFADIHIYLPTMADPQYTSMGSGISDCLADFFLLLLLPRRSRKTGRLFLFDPFLSSFLDHILRNATSWLSVSRRWERCGRVSPKPSWWVAKEEKTGHGARNERVFSDLREVVRLLAAHPRSRRTIASSLSRFAFVLGIPYSPE